MLESSLYSFLARRGPPVSRLARRYSGGTVVCTRRARDTRVALLPTEYYARASWWPKGRAPGCGFSASSERRGGGRGRRAGQRNMRVHERRVIRQFSRSDCLWTLRSRVHPRRRPGAQGAGGPGGLHHYIASLSHVTSYAPVVCEAAQISPETVPPPPKGAATHSQIALRLVRRFLRVCPRLSPP